MKLLCLYEKINNNNYLITNRYNTEYYSEDSFKGKDYIILDESLFPPYNNEAGFIYTYHININYPDKIWIEENARELDKDERVELVLNNYDNIVELFNQVDILKDEMESIKSNLSLPPPDGNI